MKGSKGRQKQTKTDSAKQCRDIQKFFQRPLTRDNAPAAISKFLHEFAKKPYLDPTVRTAIQEYPPILTGAPHLGEPSSPGSTRYGPVTGEGVLKSQAAWNLLIGLIMAMAYFPRWVEWGLLDDDDMRVVNNLRKAAAPWLKDKSSASFAFKPKRFEKSDAALLRETLNFLFPMIINELFHPVQPMLRIPATTGGVQPVRAEIKDANGLFAYVARIFWENPDNLGWENPKKLCRIRFCKAPSCHAILVVPNRKQTTCGAPCFREAARQDKPEGLDGGWPTD